MIEFPKKITKSATNLIKRLCRFSQASQICQTGNNCFSSSEASVSLNRDDWRRVCRNVRKMVELWNLSICNEQPVSRVYQYSRQCIGFCFSPPPTLSLNWTDLYQSWQPHAYDVFYWRTRFKHFSFLIFIYHCCGFSTWKFRTVASDVFCHRVALKCAKTKLKIVEANFEIPLTTMPLI